MFSFFFCLKYLFTIKLSCLQKNNFGHTMQFAAILTLLETKQVLRILQTIKYTHFSTKIKCLSLSHQLIFNTKLENREVSRCIHASLNLHHQEDNFSDQKDCLNLERNLWCPQFSQKANVGIILCTGNHPSVRFLGELRTP